MLDAVDPELLPVLALRLRALGSMVRSTRSSTSDSNLARVIFSARCFGPVASAVM